MDELKNYSGLFIIASDKEESIDDVKNSINAIITENSGKIEKDKLIGKRELATPIKKKKTGIYYQVSFSAKPGDVPKMTRQFRITNSIMRSLIDRA
jgi:small subunit ribosomal protein S6